MVMETLIFNNPDTVLSRKVDIVAKIDNPDLDLFLISV